MTGFTGRILGGPGHDLQVVPCSGTVATQQKCFMNGNVWLPLLRYICDLFA